MSIPTARDQIPRIFGFFGKKKWGMSVARLRPLSMPIVERYGKTSLFKSNIMRFGYLRIGQCEGDIGRLNSGAYKAAPASHRTVSTVPPEIPLNSWLFSSFAHSFSRHLMPTLEPKSLKPACLNSLMKALQVAPCNPQLLQALPFLQHVHIETLKHSETHYCTGIDWNWIRHSPMS